MISLAVELQELRDSEADALHQGIKGTGFKHETGDILTGGDPDARLVIPEHLNAICHHGHLLYRIIPQAEANRSEQSVNNMAKGVKR